MGGGITAKNGVKLHVFSAEASKNVDLVVPRRRKENFGNFLKFLENILYVYSIIIFIEILLYNFF